WCTAHGSCLCVDAGDAHPSDSDPPRPGADLDLARTLSEARGSGRGLSAPHRAAPTAILSGSRWLSSSRMPSLRIDSLSFLRTIYKKAKLITILRRRIAFGR